VSNAGAAGRANDLLGEDGLGGAGARAEGQVLTDDAGRLGRLLVVDPRLLLHVIAQAIHEPLRLITHDAKVSAYSNSFMLI
jgi:hypothetical protein